MLAEELNLTTVGVPHCPLCNRAGELRYTGLKDRVWFAPGMWNYRACMECDVLWLDPRPTPECFPLIYPMDYTTHDEPVNPLAPPGGIFAKLRFQLKLEILKNAYGYPIESSKPFIRVPGKLLSLIPAVKLQAGNTVRFLPHSSGRLLDVGCGNGEFLLMMSGLGWEVEGIEPDGTAALVAQRSGIKVDQRPIESAELEADNFDAVTLHHVIEHTSDPLKALKKVTAALKPGGILVSISPNPSSFLRRFFGGAWRGLEPPRHYTLFGPKALRNLAILVGLTPMVWTTSRYSRWTTEQSIGLLRTPGVSAYRRSMLPLAIAWFSKFLNVLSKDLGEEVVLFAVKRK